VSQSERIGEGVARYPAQGVPVHGENTEPAALSRLVEVAVKAKGYGRGLDRKGALPKRRWITTTLRISPLTGRPRE
jgi:hypothetical protein